MSRLSNRFAPSNGDALADAHFDDSGAILTEPGEPQTGKPGKPAGIGPKTTRLSDVVRRPVRWLWPARVPSGKLTLFFGDPSLGKSFVTLDMAARVSTGAAWPDGSGRAPRGTTILLSAEDAADDTICPRLDAMRADTSKIISLDCIQSPGKRGTTLERSFTLADVRHLRQVIDEKPDTRLVVIDPISAYLADADSHKNSDIRGLLAPLAKLAEERDVAIILVNHMSKSGGARAMYRAMGSLAFVAAARAAWCFVPDPDLEGRALFLPAKNNLAKSPGGLAYCITDGGVVGWASGRVDMTADEALADVAGDVGRPADDRKAAETWLAGLLADGEEHPFADVAKAAASEGIGQKTLQRASVKLQVVKQRSGFGGAFIWRKLRPAPAHTGQAVHTDNLVQNVQYDEIGESA